MGGNEDSADGTRTRAYRISYEACYGDNDEEDEERNEVLDVAHIWSRSVAEWLNIRDGILGG